MSSRPVTEWDESVFNVFVRSGEGFEIVDHVFAYDVFHVAQKLARHLPAREFDTIRFLRSEIRGFWVITFELTADSPEVHDKIVEEYFVRKD